MIHLEPNEQLIAVVRKHWLILIFNVWYLIGIVLLPAFLYLAHQLIPLPDIVVVAGNPALLWIFFTALWLLVCWLTFFVAWTDYYLDVLIITNQRIFDIEQTGLFSRSSSTFRLDRIQDVTVEVRGLVPTLLRFGSINIETAGEGPDFIAGYVPRPYDIKQLIMEQHDRSIELQRTVRIE